MYIYVLLLEQNKFYVGKTKNPEFRITDHITQNGSAWTKKYKPIQIHELKPDCDDGDEDKITLKYMKDKGIEHVRGGSFCEIILDEGTKKILNKIINGTSNNCYNCGEKGHFINNCDKKINEEPVEFHTNKTVGKFKCKKCGKGFNTKKGAQYHENIYCKKKAEVYECKCGEQFESYSVAIKHQKNCSGVTYECEYCNKEFDTERAIILHMAKYCKKIKNKRKYDIDCDSDNSDDNYDDNYDETENLCFRCGRDGHFANKCYAKKHVDGYFI